jgi:hypothetical protein
MENKKLKKPTSVKEQFNQGPDDMQEQRQPMTKEETIKFYEENLPFMKLQDEYEKLAFSFQERKVAALELQVRELEAIGYLSEWKAGQDVAKERKEQEEKMKAEWEAMTPEQQEEFRKQAQANLEEMEKMASQKYNQNKA